MKYQVLFSLKNEISFKLSSATLCFVLYWLTIAQLLIIFGFQTMNRLKYKAIDK